MGFYDNPQIDNASKHSEESEWALREFITQKNGFICRPLTPDKGCDFNTELIIDNHASNWHFGIQLKSDTDPNYVAAGKAISYPFETSRLGYLARQMPVPGIIVVYDVATKACYFQYVKEALDDLYTEKGTDWEDQKFVSIRIPVANRIDLLHVSNIHAYYVLGFRRAAQMHDSFGHLYGLSRSGLKPDISRYDFNNPDHIITMLEEHGINLLIEYDLHIVSSLISKLTERQIFNNTRILALSAVLNAELGQYDISEVQCNKVLKKKDITPDERVLVRYANCKNKYRLQKITLEQVISEVKEIQRENLSEQSKLTIEINLLSFRLAAVKAGDHVPDSLKQEIFDIYYRIDRSTLSPKVKFLLTLWNSDNYSSYINAIYLHEAGVALLSQSPLDKARFFKRATELNEEFLRIVERFHRIQPTQDNLLVRAYALQIWVRHLLHIEINNLNLRPETNNFAGFEGNLEQLINRALTAYNYFRQQGFDVEAYHSLCYALEFIEIGRTKLHKEMYHDIAYLYEVKAQMEEDTSIEPYELQVPKIAKRGLNNGQQLQLKNLSKEQLGQIAPMIARAKNIPVQFVPNAMMEAQAYQEFFGRCADPNIELISIYASSDERLKYAQPVRYALRNKRIDLQSAPSYNIDELLTNWGL